LGITKVLEKIKSDFHNHQDRIEITGKLRKLIKLGKKGLDIVWQDDQGYLKPGDEIAKDEFLYRSIIYTLFYANLHSASWIVKFENRLSDVAFPYIDIEVVLRSMLERLISQYFIMTEPKRLARMFTIWQIIEFKRYYKSIESIIVDDPDSLPAIMAGGRNITPWSTEQEEEYKAAVSEWESLVIPKQSADKSRSWSGISLSQMAEQADMTDFYKIYYKESSWYAHSLIHVSDYYFHYDKELNKSYYYVKPTHQEIYGCYFETVLIYHMSLELTGKTLYWNIDDKLTSIAEKRFNYPDYLVELLHILFDTI
jgi:hypothetical protein